MKAQLFAAGFAMLAFGAVAPAAMADGPRASSGNSWSGMSTPVDPQAYGVPSVSTEGPRASSGNSWSNGAVVPGPQVAAVPPGATAVAPAAEPRRVWVESYGKGGRWQGQWETVR